MAIAVDLNPCGRGFERTRNAEYRGVESTILGTTSSSITSPVSDTDKMHV